jgi:hypothetical protein
MTLLQACEWLDHSQLGTAIRESKWGFAGIEMVHLLALALLGGALAVTGLRVFGFLFRDRRPSVITGDLAGLLMGSFAALILSGLLLFADGPLRYYGNSAFRVKLILIAGAALASGLTHVIGLKSKPRETPPRAMKFATLLSLALWLAVGIAGRVIGVL